MFVAMGGRLMERLFPKETIEQCTASKGPSQGHLEVNVISSHSAIYKEASIASTRRGTAMFRDSKDLSSREKSERGRDGKFSQEEPNPPPNSEGKKGAPWTFP